MAAHNSHDPQFNVALKAMFLFLASAAVFYAGRATGGFSFLPATMAWTVPVPVIAIALLLLTHDWHKEE